MYAPIVKGGSVHASFYRIKKLNVFAPGSFRKVDGREQGEVSGPCCRLFLVLGKDLNIPLPASSKLLSLGKSQQTLRALPTYQP
jgi:hypothetical protein